MNFNSTYLHISKSVFSLCHVPLGGNSIIHIYLLYLQLYLFYYFKKKNKNKKENNQIHNKIHLFHYFMVTKTIHHFKDPIWRMWHLFGMTNETNKCSLRSFLWTTKKSHLLNSWNVFCKININLHIFLGWQNE